MGKIYFSSIENQYIYKVSKENRSHFSLIFDGLIPPNNFLFLIEIFDVGASTPVNRHAGSYEFFYVLDGDGMCISEDVTRKIKKGDAILIEPGREHAILNIGTTNLLTLTIMLADDGLFNTIINVAKEDLNSEIINVLTLR